MDNKVKAAIGVTALAAVMYFKLPILCAGCDDYSTGFRSYFFRCIEGSGKGSTMCTATKGLDSFSGEFMSLGKKVSIFTREVFLTLVVDVPSAIKDALWKVIQFLKGVLVEIKKRVGQLIGMMKWAITEVVSKVKKGIIKSIEGIKFALDQMWKAVILYIVEPIGKLIGLLFELKDKIIAAIAMIVSEASGIVYTAGHTVFEGLDIAMKAVPDGVNKALAGTTAGLNKLKDGIFIATNEALAGIVKGIEGSIGKLTDGINASSKGATKASQAVASGLTEATESSINGVVSALTASINGLVVGINTMSDGAEASVNGISRGTEAAINGLAFPVRKTVDGINSLRDKKIDLGVKKIRVFGYIPELPTVPKLEIPPARFGHVDGINIRGVSLDPPRVPAIPEVNAPGIKPPSINAPKDLNAPTIPDLPKKASPVYVYEKATEAVGNAVDKAVAGALKPIYGMISILTKLYSTIVANFWVVLNLLGEKVLDAGRALMRTGQAVLLDIVMFLKEHVLDQVVKFAKDFLKLAWTSFLYIVDILWDVLKVAIDKIRQLFSGIVHVVSTALKYVLQTTGAVILFILTSFTQWLPVPFLNDTEKLFIVMGTLVYVLLGPHGEFIGRKLGGLLSMFKRKSVVNADFIK